MAECELKMRGKAHEPPLGNLRLNNDQGFVEWTFVPITAGSLKKGKVKMEGQDSILINGPGQFNGKPYGRLVNFSLLHYNKQITYTFKSGGNVFHCKCEDDFDFNMDN